MHGGMKIRVSGQVMEKDSFQSNGGDTLRYVVIGWIGGSHKQYVSEQLFNQLPEIGDPLILEGVGESTDKGIKLRKPQLPGNSSSGMDATDDEASSRRPSRRRVAA